MSRNRAILSGVALLAGLVCTIPADATCPAARIFSTANAQGQAGITKTGGISGQRQGFFWALGSGDPTIGLGDDCGTLCGPSVSTWWLTSPPFIGGNTNNWSWPGTDGCIDETGTDPSKFDTDQCMAVLLADQSVAGDIGYFAALADDVDANGNYQLNAASPTSIVLREVPQATVTGATWISTTALDVTVSVIEPVGTSEGLYANCPLQTPTFPLVVGYRIYTHRDSAPTSRDVSSGWVQETGVVPFGSTTINSTGCNVAGEDLYICATLVFDSGFETPYCSRDAVDVLRCGGPEQECLLPPDCDDGMACNGVEDCVSGSCQAGTPIVCDDGVSCTINECIDPAGTCNYVPSDALCDNFDFCDGVETCDEVSDCQPGTDPCVDAVACTVDACNEGSDTCNFVPNNAFCSNGDFCDGVETCDPFSGCQPGSDPCNDGYTCTTDSCNEGLNSCDNAYPACNLTTDDCCGPACNLATDPDCPEVTDVSPSDDSVDVPIGTNVSVTFSKVIDPATIRPGTFKLTDASGSRVTANVDLAGSGLTATLDPVQALPLETVYRVDVTNAVKTPNGSVVVPFASFFQTDDGVSTGTPLAGVSDQTTLPSIARGAAVGANLGFSVGQAGDLNGDMISDFLGGAPGQTAGGNAEAGVAIVCLGSATAGDRTSPDIIFTGANAHDRAGVAVVGNFDFNGDGTPDILIGAEQVNRTDPDPMNHTATGNGKVYLIFFDPADYPNLGTPGTHDEIELARVDNPSHVDGEIPGAVFDGAASGDQAGFALAAGAQLEAVDAMQRDDIVIGAPGVNNGMTGDGNVYVVFSTATLGDTNNLGNVGNTISGFAYEGSAGERLGSAVALPGDVTEPAGEDIAMGAPMADTAQNNAGIVYVAEAGNLASGTDSAANISLKIRGDQQDEQLGFSVSGGGDNRHDGNPDLLIGAPFHDAGMGSRLDAGRVVQTSGRLPGGQSIDAAQVGNTMHANPIDGVIWEGAAANDNLGWAAAGVGKVTNNEHDDIGLGAPGANPGAVSSAGAVYLVEGTPTTTCESLPCADGIPSLGGTIDASLVGQITPGTVLIGTEAGESAGLIVSPTGDLSDDGNSDFAAGAPGWATGDGTIHQVLESLPPEPGECGPLGCTVADLFTGAKLAVPGGALATTVMLDVNGLAGQTCPDSFEDPPGTFNTLVGTSDLDTENQLFALAATIHIPTRREVEHQLVDSETLVVRYCDSTFGWLEAPSTSTGTVRNNEFVPGRMAVTTTTDELHLYAAFFIDNDVDDVRDTCDCAAMNGNLSTIPGRIDSLTLPDKTTLDWMPPDNQGGTAGMTGIVYDVIRSGDPTDFDGGGACLSGETNGTDLTAIDTNDPVEGAGFYYLIRAENTCNPIVAGDPSLDCFDPGLPAALACN